MVTFKLNEGVLMGYIIWCMVNVLIIMMGIEGLIENRDSVKVNIYMIMNIILSVMVCIILLMEDKVYVIMIKMMWITRVILLILGYKWFMEITGENMFEYSIKNRNSKDIPQREYSMLIILWIILIGVLIMIMGGIYKMVEWLNRKKRIISEC
jgi:hypothetical protein